MPGAGQVCLKAAHEQGNVGAECTAIGVDFVENEVAQR